MNHDRRKAQLQRQGLERREGERRRAQREDGMRQLRADTARHQRIEAAKRAHVDTGVTDWQARFHAARNGNPMSGGWQWSTVR